MAIATEDERYFTQLVNDLRKDLGLKELKLEKHLNASADAHSAWMLDVDIFSHTGKDGSSASDRIRAAGFPMDAQSWATGENIAYVSIDGDGSFRDEIETLHRNLVNSPGHYANLVSDRYELIGIGLKVGEFRVNGHDYPVLMVTQNFGYTTGQPDLDLGADAPPPTIPVNPPVEAPEAPAIQDRDDWLDGMDGDTFQASAEAIVYGTGRGDDVRLVDSDAAHVVSVMGGRDWVSGSGQDDVIHGGSGADRINGNAGNDMLIGGLGDDTILGGSGHDRIYGGQGNDLLQGGSGSEILHGGSGNDWIEGGAGNDVLRGETGNDTLDGGTGRDMLTGGSGDDTFIFRENFGRDTITDFGDGNDRILISREALGGSIEDLVSEMRMQGDDVIITVAGQGEIRVAGDGLTIQNVADDIFIF